MSLWDNGLHWYLLFSNVTYLWTLYLEVRQYRKIQADLAIERNTKKEEADRVPSTTNDKSRLQMLQYTAAKSRLSMLQNGISHATEVTLWALGVLPRLWDWCGTQLLTWQGLCHPMGLEIGHALLFVSLNSLGTTLLALPFSAYSTFGIEARHGFNKMTPRVFVLDQLKAVLLFVSLGLPLQALFLWLLMLSGAHHMVYAVLGFSLAAALFVQALYPAVIRPLFNKTTPLAPGALRTSIEALAGRLGFPLANVYVMDGSLRSSHSNAYFFGMFRNKHIVLYDTLLDQCVGKDDDILAVIGHELGHWACWHTVVNFGLQQLLVLGFAVGARLVIGHAQLYHDFGFHSSSPFLAPNQLASSGGHAMYVGVMLASLLFSPLFTLASYLLVVLSRLFEYQADAFAVRLGYGVHLIDSLRTLAVENLSYDDPDPLYSWCHHSHPPMPHRVAAIQKLLKKAL